MPAYAPRALRPRARRSISALLLVVLVATGLASCSSDEADVPATAQAISAAARKSLAANTGRMRLRVTAPALDGRTEADDRAPMDLQVAGAFVVKQKLFQVEATLGSLAPLLGAHAGDLGPQAASEVRIVSDDGNAFVRVEEIPLLATLVGGKPWLAIGKSSTGQLRSSDPTVLLRSLQGTRGAVTRVGEARIRGVTCVHLRSRLRLPEGASLAQFGVEEAPASLPLDVWIDGDQLIRRVEVRVDLKAAGVGRGTGVVATDLYDLGSTLSITVPDRDEVGSLPAGLLEGIASQGVDGRTAQWQAADDADP